MTNRFQYRLAQRSAVIVAACSLLGGAAGCGQAEARTQPPVASTAQALDVTDIAAQCGLVCPGGTDDKGVEVKGIAEGNAAISGVASVDAFFASVINFQGAATGVAGGVKAQLDAIRGDFGIAADADLAAELKAQISANIEGALTVDYQEARCEADVQATLQAQARCDAEFDPGKAMVECKGSCDVEASADAKCDADADLECTFTPPDLKCMGSCSGTCSADFSAAADCSGKCTGSCSGSCSAYVDDGNGGTQCAGKCDGMCTGHCDFEVAGGAMCEGECKGECTVTNPSGGCEGGIKAQCKAHADAMVMCDGKCEGDFEPPMAKAECQASAKADAKVNVQCTPPKVAISYKLKAVASADVQAQAKFEAALKTLASTRLPALLAEIKRGESVVDAGAGLATSAGGSVMGAVQAAAGGNLSVKATFGLGCAVKELPKVGNVITSASADLKAQLTAAGKLTAALKG